MGTRGPTPKRSDQRRRRNKPATPVTHSAGAVKVDAPEPGEDWHPIAARWYAALGKSGQSAFYEPSDWETAYLLAESMSRDLHPQVVTVTQSGEIIRESLPLKGANLAAYLRAMTALLVTEGDRRRAGVELQRLQPGDGEESAGVTDIRAWKESLGS